MSLGPLTQNKSLHRLVFDHYLRTGEQLTEHEWLARQESKFNPYHDELGRFSSPPGVTVSWGHSGGPRAPRADGRRRDTMQGERPGVPKITGSSKRPRGPAAPKSGPTPSQFRSDFVRGAVSPQSTHAETHFELNKRQAYLNQLRSDAGPNPDAVVKADLDDFQRRLDADRQRLDARASQIDSETTEILRAGFAPVDVGLGAAKIATGNGEVRDYVAVAGAIPFAGAVGKLGKLAKVGKVAKATEAPTEAIVQLGGPYKIVKKLRGTDAHHLVSKKVSPLPHGDGPSIAMRPKHHRDTASFGNRRGAPEFRQKQAELVAKGDFDGAMQMGVDDVRSKFGNLYDDAIEQALAAHRKKD
jgi:hypothetical protein